MDQLPFRRISGVLYGWDRICRATARMVDSCVSSTGGSNCRWVPDPLRHRLPKQARSGLNRIHKRTFKAPSKFNEDISWAPSKPPKCSHIISCPTEGFPYRRLLARAPNSSRTRTTSFASQMRLRLPLEIWIKMPASTRRLIAT